MKILRFTLLMLALLAPSSLMAATGSDPAGTTEAVRTGVMLAVLAIIPALLISTTSFIRIVVVLAMVRHAFGMPQTPPNTVLTSLALFMTAFVMAPTLTQVNEQALQPFLDGSADIEQAMDGGSGPLKEFMLRHTREKDLEMVYRVSGTPLPATPDDVQILKLTPSSCRAIIGCWLRQDLSIRMAIGSQNRW